MAREFAKKFYSSKAWQDTRNAYSKSVGHLCEQCLRFGIYRPAEIIHHKIEITPKNIENPEITLSFNNLEAVCRACHAKLHDNKTRRATGERYVIDVDGAVRPR